MNRTLPPPTRQWRPSSRWARVRSLAQHWMTPLLGATTALLLLALATAPAAADAPAGVAPAGRGSALPDPTRPPAALRSVEAGTATGTGTSPVTGTLQLQSVRLGQGTDKGKAPVAIINGQVLSVGDTLGEWRLQRVNEHAAWLAGPAGVLVLALHPGIDRAPARSEVPSAPGVPTLKARSAARLAASRTHDTDRPAAPTRSLEPR